MGFSNEWDERYKENTHLSIWPWSDIVSMVMRYSRPNSDKFKVLELGCGAGANIPLFSSLNVDYYAVDGSETIIKQIQKEYPKYKNNILCGDFIKNIPLEKFDLIIDRASLTHNTTNDIKECLSKCYYQLKKGGKFIGSDWYSTEYSDYEIGDSTDDIWTKNNFTEGSFAFAGKVHFSDKDHILELFKDFKILHMQHKIIQQEIPKNDWHFASWNFVAEKV